MIGATTIDIRAFGTWSVSIDGVEAPQVRSRYAREILIAIALGPAPVLRDQLIDRLRPDATDRRAARRRLTQELSRLQSTFGVPLWVPHRDTIDVVEGTRLHCDVAVVLDEREPGHVAALSSVRRTRTLEDIVDRIDRGPLLAGHESAWAEALRDRVASRELQTRRELLGLLPAGDAARRLEHARRMTDIDPFDDAAHAVAIRAVRALQGPDAADAETDRIAAWYAAELGLDRLPAAITAVADDDVHDVPALLRDEARVRRALAAATEPDAALSLSLELDDVLRRRGDEIARATLLESFAPSETPETPEIAWRLAEVRLAQANAAEAQRLLDGAADGSGAAADRLQLTQALVDHICGDNAAAHLSLESLVASAPGAPLEIEANLILERILDGMGDSRESRNCCLVALDLARSTERDHDEAAALAALGWSLARSFQLDEADSTLRRALALAEDIGADRVRATALGGLGLLAYWGRRHATSMAHLRSAALLAERNGDLTALIRWTANEAVPGETIGDLARLAEIHHALTNMPARAITVSAQARIGQIEVQLAHARGDLDEALALQSRVSDQLARTGEHLASLFSKNACVAFLIGLDRIDEALELARRNLAHGQELRLPPTVMQILEMRVGAALVASGSASEGVALLEQAIEHGQPGQMLSPTCHVYFGQGLEQLGRHDDADRLRRSVRQMLDAFREDLNDVQWERALRQSTVVRELAPLAGLPLPDGAGEPLGQS